MTDKLILDPCCGSRMSWFDKQHPNVVYSDIRTETHELCDGRILEIKPDVEMDCRKLDYPDETFYHVTLDPPHFNKLGKSSWMAKKYGVLLPSWELDIHSMFSESMRVLKTYGTLTFKWNVAQLSLKQVLEVIKVQPLYGHTSGRHGKTIWLCFMKMPVK